MGKIIAVANQKGGVGKTTTAINMSAGLTLRKKKVLLCDFDPQGNASTGFGINLLKLNTTIYDVMLRDLNAKDAIVHTKWCDVLPANVTLAAAEIEMVDLEKREYRLKNVLEPMREEYDYIIIDCPPSLGLLTLNALIAADTVLVPMQCEYYALEGLSQLTNTIKMVRRALNPELDIEGIILTMYDGRTNLCIQVADEIKKHFGDKLFATPITRNIRLSEAPSHGKPIMAYDKLSKGADCYVRVTDELLRRNKDR